MNIGLALFRYFPYGGLQRDMYAIAGVLRDRGHRVQVFTRQWQGERPAGIEVITVPVHALTNHGADAAFARQIAAPLARCDVRVGFNKMAGLDWYYAADGCLAARAPTSPARWLPRYRTRLAQEAAVFGADTGTRILSISPPQKALFQKCYDTPAARFVDLPPGIRRDRAMPADYLQQRRALRQRLAMPEDGRLFLFVGSGFRTKGLDRAIATAARVMKGNDQFHVVGADRAGPYQRQAANLGISRQVFFNGGQDNIPQWLWAADLLLHPAYAENTGTVLLEAAIAGVPVLTTSACGYAPYIHDAGMGAVVDADRASDEQLAERAVGLLRVPRQSWLPKAREFAAGADIYSLVSHAADAIEETS